MHAFSARPFRLPLLLTTLVAAVFGAVLARRGAHLRESRLRQRLLERKLARMERENAQLRAQRDALLSSPEAIERTAREDYGFAAPGEVVRDFDSSRIPTAHMPADSAADTLWDRALTSPNLAVALTAGVFVVTALLLGLINVVGRTGAR